VVASARAGFASAEMKWHGSMAVIVLVGRAEIFPPGNETLCASEGAAMAITFMPFAVLSLLRT